MRRHSLFQLPRSVGALLAAALFGSVFQACWTPAGASPGASLGPATPPATGSFFLDVANLDGPRVTVSVNGVALATVSCQLSGARGPVLRPSPSNPLPWAVVVTTPGGTVLTSFQENGDKGPMALLIRGDQAGEVPSDTAFGGPMPVGTCAP